MARADLSRLGPVVITGANGFVGMNLCRHFLARGAQVIALEGPSLQPWRLRTLAGLQTVHLDIRDAAAVSAFVQRHQPGALINCAVYGAYSQQTDADLTYAVNVNGVRNLLEALRGCSSLRAFIQAGSSSEYGLNCGGPGEDAPTWPDSHYAVSKVAATALIRFYACKHQLPAFCLRLYSVYGPFEDTSRLIPRLLQAARQQKLPPLVDPDISRDFVYVDDVAKAFEQVIARAPKLGKGEVFNIGAGRKVTLRQLVSVARKTFGIPDRPAWGSMPNRAWDHAGWYANPRKAARQLGWKASTPLARGLEATLAWMEQNPAIVSEADRFTVAKAAGA